MTIRIRRASVTFEGGGVSAARATGVARRALAAAAPTAASAACPAGPAAAPVGRIGRLTVEVPARAWTGRSDERLARAIGQAVEAEVRRRLGGGGR
jgi:hypothetical protein